MFEFIPIFIGWYNIAIAYAIIDAEDLYLVENYRWTTSNFGYPMAKSSGKMIRMHRLVVDCPDNMVVDHINGNPLDARKANLRICTQKQNSCNRAAYSTNTTGYKGVSFSKQHQSYRATIMVDGKQKSLGLYDCPIAAAQAYNDAAKELHKEYALLNDITPISEQQMFERKKRSKPAAVERNICIQRYGRDKKFFKYQVRVRQKYIGLFSTLEEARAARDAAHAAI